MDITTAKQQVIDAGKRLVETGLIARTWGNVSCRVDDNHFVITPSGKAYDSLTQADIVLVSIDKLEYDGDIKPSSEKGVHAEVYKARPDVGFVIHTHQDKASVISALDQGLSNLSPELAEILGDRVPLAAYGLPGMKKLRNGVAKALQQTTGNAVIMRHHGALCYAADDQKTFQVAASLEIACEEAVQQRYQQKFGKRAEDDTDFARNVINLTEKRKIILAEQSSSCYNSICDAEKNVITYTDAAGTTRQTTFRYAAQEEPAALAWHRAIYQAREDIRVVLHASIPSVRAISARGVTMQPQLDDFAQIIGVNVQVVPRGQLQNAAAVVKALKGRHAVLLEGKGALCCGKNESDARAVEMILEKGCATKLGSVLFGSNNVISRIESQLMRFIYLTKYSKKE